MPEHPTWYRRLPGIIAELQKSGEPYVDTATIEFLLEVSRRRAQQILRPCVVKQIGRTGLADRDDVVRRLREIAEGDTGLREIARRRKVAGLITALRQDRAEGRSLIVEAPTRVVNQDFGTLPEGVSVVRGRITVEFREPQEALEKLLALAMAIGNNFEKFEELGGVS